MLTVSMTHCLNYSHGLHSLSDWLTVSLTCTALHLLSQLLTVSLAHCLSCSLSQLSHSSHTALALAHKHGTLRKLRHAQPTTSLHYLSANRTHWSGCQPVFRLLVLGAGVEEGVRGLAPR